MTTHYGQWGWAVVMVLIASWVLYRFIAPKTWQEWTGAGLVQAFIIALYAEMYGFPLTIYLLTGFLGVDIPLTPYAGHLWATWLGYGLAGATVEMLLAEVFIVPGILLLVRGWIQVYGASRQQHLATNALYGVVRHPQYAGIFLIIFGQNVHWPTLMTLALFPIIVWVYIRLARKEEAASIERFGEEYVSYRARVPMFFPQRGDWYRFGRALVYPSED
ncbi:MAG: isoprenylcysteine carboxylmethyltransferase family protein [Burkholderiaceae bacterium]|nr:MAG: isoprenylcysteine carboxylmethyltransferase family protein [Burkholderiaceae bacterium]